MTYRTVGRPAEKRIDHGRVFTIQGQRLVMYDRDHVQAALEDAGKTLMQLPAHGTKPQGFVSQMPEPLQNFWIIYASQAPRVRWPQATRRAIDRMDAVLTWLTYIDDPGKARVVALRMLIHPLSDRPMFRWREIGQRFGISDRTAKRWFDDGCDQIAGKLSEIDIQSCA